MASACHTSMREGDYKCRETPSAAPGGEQMKGRPPFYELWRCGSGNPQGHLSSQQYVSSSIPIGVSQVKEPDGIYTPTWFIQYMMAELSVITRMSLLHRRTSNATSALGTAN